MENKERLPYEKPTVEKVEFDFSDRIAASGSCDSLPIAETVPGYGGHCSEI